MVEPSLIRIEADELTYPLHIMIRYEIERDLFNGDLQAKDLPQVWNDKYEEYLGIRPETDAQGITRHALVRWHVWLFPILCIRNDLCSAMEARDGQGYS